MELLTTTLNDINDISTKFVAIDNDYLRVDIINNQAVLGVPVKELRNLKALNSRLEDLIVDMKLLKLNSICTKEIKKAISFLSYHKRQTILNNPIKFDSKRSF